MGSASGLSLRQLLSSGFLSLLLLVVLSSCNQDRGGDSGSLFRSIPATHSLIAFENSLTETDTFNYFLYSYIYMGGGVSAGDFNSDGLTDLYFVGNMEPNHLYLNKGDFQFEEVGQPSHTAGDQRWMLGSTLCDINNDGMPERGRYSGFHRSS
jgi:hypothetical protein